MSIVRRLLTHHRPDAQSDREMAAELARIHDLHRAGIINAVEERSLRTRLLVDGSLRRAA
jgi:hypothetical protein